MYHGSLVSIAAFAALLVLAPQDPVPAPPPKPAPSATAPAQAPAANRFGPEAMAKLAWISGTWVMKQGESVTEEHWRPLQGSTLLGSSHTFGGERTMAFEFLRIGEVRGQIGYVAMPGGKAPTTFLLETLADGVAEFVNGEHDYPQRIRYERTEKGLTATISRLDGTKVLSFVFAKKT